MSLFIWLTQNLHYLRELLDLIGVCLSSMAAEIAACGSQYCYLLPLLDHLLMNVLILHSANCLSNSVHLLDLPKGIELHQIIVKLPKHIVSIGFLINARAFSYCVY